MTRWNKLVLWRMVHANRILLQQMLRTRRLAAGFLLLAFASSATKAADDLASHPMDISDEQLFAALDVGRPGLAGVRAAVEQADYGRARKEWAEYFRNREKPTPHFSRDTWPAFIRDEFPQLVGPILAAADKVAGGEIAHPGVSLPVDGRQINWLHNPSKDTNYVSLVGSQWFLNPLGRAYLLTGEEKYAKAFAWVFESWYDHQKEIVKFQGGLGFNPVYRAYYPGIRVRILIDNYYCLARSPSLTPPVHLKLMKQVLGSASWLYKREQGYRRGNQQVAAVLGLGIAGLVFPEFKGAERWVACAEARMSEHLERDFFADGGHKELCTQYHKTCLRDIAYVALTAERNGRRSLFRSEAGPSLENAYDWLSRLLMPTGETPALHSAVFATDAAVHLLIGARYFSRADFLWYAQRFWSRGEVPNQKAPFAFACFLLTESLSRGQMGGLRPSPPDFQSVHLRESGFAVMRSGWKEKDRYLVFQYGWANTGHAYPGALAFAFQSNGELLATNPGSPRSYRHPAYRYCHSTPSHNVVSIDMQSYRSDGGLAPGGKLRSYADLPGAWYVSASHEGYRKRFGAVHRRSLLAVKDGPLWVRDLIEGGQGHVAQWNFHTPLELAVKEDRTAVLHGRTTYWLCPAFAEEIAFVKTDKRWEAVLPRDCQPGDCGKVIPVLRYEKPIGATGVQFCVAVVEGEGRIEPLNRQAFRLRTPDSTYVVLYRDRAARIEAAGIATDAECTCIRFADKRPERAWVIRGKRLTVRGTVWMDTNVPRTRELTAPASVSSCSGR